jgi:hypothetical protein
VTHGIQDYIDPASEKIEDCLDEEDLLQEIAACYSLTQEVIPDANLDPVIPVRLLKLLLLYNPLRLGRAVRR